ncbi:MAG TPA: beta-ketoacyl-ACP synthase II [Solirubrobacterales bacterium]|nr:beta-ketoacyl-ACP synthase II [Solirubrobacterales bacterium]
MTRKVAITAVGVVSPLGVGARSLIDRWTAGESGIVDGLAPANEFEPTDHLTRREARRSDRFTQFAAVAAKEAIDAAGWGDEKPYDPGDIGCVIGTGIGGISTIEEQHTLLQQNGGGGGVSPLCVPQMMANAAAGQVAIRHGLKGECYGTVSACAAGGQAVGAGLRMVQHGDADACVVGGTEAAITPLAMTAFREMGATSKEGVSRPFDRRRDGFVMGEGAGILVLEEASAAEARGAPILGYLAGYGATADAHHLTAPDPDGDGAARAIERALADAGREPAEIDYVNAHGTSTPLNDRSETEALKRVLGDRAASVPVSSLKSSIGHLLGAAGAVEAVATVLALSDGVAPPTLNYEEPDEGLDLDYVPNQSRKLERNGRPPVAISNSFGFGGHNVVLCIEGGP